MTNVNLIPLPRRHARIQRAHVRRCATGCIAWGVAMTMLAVGAFVLGGNGDSSVSRRLSQATTEMKRSDDALAAARRELGTAQSTLRVSESILNQPDWSILLSLLSEKMGDDIVLRSCEVKPVEKNATSPAPASASSAKYVLTAGGLGKTQLAVTQFVLRLEQSGLFGQINFNTVTEPFLKGEAVAFHLECTLDESGGTK